MTQVVQGILIPFLGTTLGAACTVFEKQSSNQCTADFNGLCCWNYDRCLCLESVDSSFRAGI